MMSKEIELRIKSELKNVELIGYAVNSIVLEFGLTSNEACLMELAVVEAVNNSIEHSYNNDSEKEISVILKVSVQQIEIKIIDQGEPLNDLKSTYDENFDINDVENFPEGGRGLFIINQIADELNYQTNENNNILTIIKNLGK